MGSFVPVGENLKGFSNFLKPGFSCFPVFLVLVRVPFRGQFLVGVLDFKEGGVFRDAKDCVIVLKLLSAHSRLIRLFQIMI